MKLLLALLMAGVAGCAALRPPTDAPSASAQAWLLSIPEQGGHASGVAVGCTEAPNGAGGYVVRMLTAAHVAANGTGWTAQCGDRTLYGGLTVSIAPGMDAALIDFFSMAPVPVAALRWDEPHVGERVWVSGYGGSSAEFWVSDGYQTGHGRSSAPIFFGDSGGPLVDARGRLLGITTGVEVSLGAVVYHHGWYVPVTDLAGWLRSLL